MLFMLDLQNTILVATLGLRFVRVLGMWTRIPQNIILVATLGSG